MTKRTWLLYAFLLAILAAVIATNNKKPETVETPSPTTQETHTEPLMKKRINYTILFQNAPKRTQSAHREPVETPSEEPTAEATEEIRETYRFVATGYSSAWEENGGYGAVDCRYGQPLPSNAIAADLSILPYGTRVYIEGYGEKIVVDTASKATITRTQAMADQRDCIGWIDIYFGDDTQQASDWGVQVVTLEIIEWGDGR